MNPEWTDAMIEDYLNIYESLITLAELLDVEIDQKIEEIATDFTDGSIPFADSNLLIEDNTNLKWDNANDILSALNILTDKITFNLTAGLTPAEGEMSWNIEDGTLNLGLPGGSVVLQIGQEVHAPRSRAVGSNIDNGQLVYVSGATGAVPEMTLAKADASATASGTIAMATEDVIQNQLGYYTTFGLVRDVNTDPVTYTAGDQLYLSAAIAGEYTNVKPGLENFIIKAGIVIRAHATEGVILTKIVQRSNNYAHIRFGIHRDTTTATIDNTAYQWNGNTDSAGFAYTLPAGVQGELHKIVNTGTSGNQLEITPNGAEFLLGENSSFYLFDGESLIISYDSTDGWQ